MIPPRLLGRWPWGAGPLGLALSAILALFAVAGAEEPEELGVRQVAISADGKLLAACTGEPEDASVVTLWDIATRRPLWSHRENRGIPAVAFAPDSRTLAIGIFDPNAKLLDAATGRVLASFGGNGAAARSVAFSPDGKTLAVGSYDRLIRLYDVATGAAGKVLKGHTEWVFSLAFSRDGTRLLSGGYDQIRLWDPVTGQEVRRFTPGGRGACFTPDEEWVLAGTRDGAVCVWQVRTGERRVRFQSLGGANGVAFDPTTRTLAVASYAPSIQLFELNLEEPGEKDRERVRRLLVKLNDDAYDVREAASREILGVGLVAEPELRRAMNESPSAEVRIRARRLRREILSQPRAVLTGHASYVESLALTPDSKLLASGSKDGTVRLWDMATRKELARLMPGQKEAQ